MVALFKFLIVSGFAYLFFSILRDKCFKQMILMTVAITLFGSGYLWTINLEKKVGEKTENINNKIDGLKQSVDNFNKSVDKVGKPIKDVGKTVKKAEDKLNKLDESIENRYKNLKDKVFGKKE